MVISLKGSLPFPESSIPWHNLQGLPVSLSFSKSSKYKLSIAFLYVKYMIKKKFKKIEKRIMAVVIETTIGDFTIDLYTDERPQSEYTIVSFCSTIKKACFVC